MKETLKTLGIMGGIAMLGNLVKYLRHHRNEDFDWQEFLIGMLGAGMVGMIAYGLCEWAEVPQLASGAIVAMVGYCGGPLLDVFAQAIKTCMTDGVKALIDRFGQKW